MESAVDDPVLTLSHTGAHSGGPSRDAIAEWQDLRVHDKMREVVEDARNRLEAYMYKHDMPLIVYEGRAQWYRESVRPRRSWEPVPVVAETFLDAIPRELVMAKVWPRLMDGLTEVESFRICCNLRCVCTAWKAFVEGTFEWHVGFSAWCRGEHRDLFGEETDPYAETSSSSYFEESEPEHSIDSEESILPV